MGTVGNGFVLPDSRLGVPDIDMLASIFPRRIQHLQLPGLLFVAGTLSGTFVEPGH